MQTTKPRKGYKLVKRSNIKKWDENSNNWGDWVEEIPEDWELRRLEEFCKEQKNTFNQNADIHVHIQQDDYNHY